MTRARRSLLAGAAWAATAWGPLAAQDVPPTIVVASKSFTEGVILGELAAGDIEDDRYAVRRRRELGGTRVLFNALVSGAIDVYGEYTGTIVEEILADLSVVSGMFLDLRRAQTPGQFHSHTRSRQRTRAVSSTALIASAMAEPAAALRVGGGKRPGARPRSGIPRAGRG